jgi:hypothetical protein
MTYRLLLLVLAFVLAAPLASAAPDVGSLGGSRQVAIDNVSDLPELSIDDVTLAEGDSGAATATFTVTLSAVSGQIVEVSFATADDTASAPDDYLPAAGTLVFDPGQTTQSVSVTINGDTIDEANETYFVNLSNPVNATIADGQGLGTITDDDSPPALSIDDVTVTEGNAGTTDATFTVSLSSPSGNAVSVDFATENGTATAPGDYLAASGTLVFDPGQTTESVSVTVNGDTLDEADETYFVNLSNPVNATIADAQGLGTITDDDPLPALSIDDVSVVERNVGNSNATFTVSLSAPSGVVVSVDYATADGTATAGSDYQARNDTLTFSAGQTTRTLNVRIYGDTIAEADETYFVNLSNPVNATIADGQGLGTIVNDDGPPPPPPPPPTPPPPPPPP